MATATQIVETVIPDSEERFEEVFREGMLTLKPGGEGIDFQMDDFLTLTAPGVAPVKVRYATGRRIVLRVLEYLAIAQLEEKVRKSWKIPFNESTQLSKGRGVRFYISAEDRAYFRTLLGLIPQTPFFRGVLAGDDADIWNLYFDGAGFTLEEIAAKLNCSHQNISKRLRGCAAKLNACFRERRAAGIKPPMEYEAFVIKLREYDPTIPQYDFEYSFELFYKFMRRYEQQGAAAAMQMARGISGDFAGLSIRGVGTRINL
jgi:hypothetical protein